MRSDRLVHIVSAHCAGEVGDVIVGGVAPPPGDTPWERSRWIHDDGALRRFVLNEPRGGVFRHVNLLVPPRSPGAAWGFIVMEPEHTPPMSGSNAICVATVLLETGMVAMTEPETVFTLEAPAGLVKVRAACRDGRALSVEIANVASFADRLDAPLEIEGRGALNVDIAYGGDSFVIVDAAALGFGIVPDEAADLAALGARITAAANEQLGFRHPERPDWAHVSFCQFAMPIERRGGGAPEGRNAVVVDPGKIDRSPCGTGCSARMAALFARRVLKVGDRFAGVSILGTRFECRVAGETSVAGRPAMLPAIAGRAHLTGTHQLTRDPDDPFPEGYRLTDTWPATRP